MSRCRSSRQTSGGAGSPAPPDELLDAGLRYLPRTIPLVGKSPQRAVGKGWPRWVATRESVTSYFTSHPHANVGIRTGQGLVVLDRDDWDGGHESLDQLERAHGKLPATPTVITGSGSRHFYFRGPPQLRSRNLRAIGIPGLEIKAAGTQVAAPPSLHEGGRLFVWDPAHPLIESEIAPLPAWLVELAGERKASKPTTVNTDDPLRSIPATVYVPSLLGVTVGSDYKCLCPFHAETEPSLHVYSRNRGWFCYGCERGGGIIDLAALILGIEPRGSGYWRIRERLEQHLGVSA